MVLKLCAFVSLSLETLRQIELTKPGWAARNLDGVMLVSPDVNLDVFRSQTAVFKTWPQPFVIFASQKDAALRLSGRLRGEDRQVGKLVNAKELSDLPISYVDVTAFSDGDTPNHFVAGSSESFIKLIRSTTQVEQAFLRGQSVASTSILGTSRVVGHATEILLLPGDR